jgi:hypothetical protein
MTLTVRDACTGNRVTTEVPARPQSRRIRRWVLREVDRAAVQHQQAMKQLAGAAGGLPT